MPESYLLKKSLEIYFLKYSNYISLHLILTLEGKNPPNIFLHEYKEPHVSREQAESWRL